MTPEVFIALVMVGAGAILGILTLIAEWRGW